MRLRSATLFLTYTVAIGSILWAIACLPRFWQSAPAAYLAARIVQGEPFTTEQLRPIANLAHRAADGACYAPVERSAAIIRLRIVENDQQSGAAAFDKDINELRDASLRSLSCVPGDSFLWLILFWANANANGFQEKDFDLLRMSFREGPNEGWVIIRRNRLMLPMYRLLPPDLQHLTLDDFQKLMQPQFITVALDYFLGAGRGIQPLLLEDMKTVPELQRRRFFELAQEKGAIIPVPGIPFPAKQ